MPERTSHSSGGDFYASIADYIDQTELAHQDKRQPLATLSQNARGLAQRTGDFVEIPVERLSRASGPPVTKQDRQVEHIDRAIVI